MGLCLLFDTIEILEELRLAFLMGNPFEIDKIGRRLSDRCNNMNHAQVWNDDFLEAFVLVVAMRDAFRKYGHRKVEEAHLQHPRHDCTVLEEIEFEAVLTQCDSSTTGTFLGDCDDLPTA